MTNLIKDFIHYRFYSKNKALYKEIAKKVNRTPLYVYRIAHGKKAKSLTDMDILHILMEYNIIADVKIAYD